MSYQVQCIAVNGASMPKSIETLVHTPDNWKYLQIDTVSDDMISRYTPHTSVFTILGQNGATTTGVAAITGLTAVDNTDGVVHQTTFKLSAMPLVVTDALAYAGLKLFDFTKGRILVSGVTSSLAFAVTTSRAASSGTINDSASMTYALGSVTASNITLTSTMVDILPKTTKVLDGAVAAYTTVSKAALAVQASQFDGTTTAAAMFLNVGFETNTDIDNDGTLNITGNITVTWENLGTY